ncbi:hypothetical protein CBL_10616 [Carabus blaptoides fortunei]
MNLKLDKEQGINKDAEQVHIEEVTSTNFENPQIESFEKVVAVRKLENRMEISDITQGTLIIDEKQDVAVDEETNSSEISKLVTAESDTEAKESIKKPQKPVDDQIVKMMVYAHACKPVRMPAISFFASAGRMPNLCYRFGQSRILKKYAE